MVSEMDNKISISLLQKHFENKNLINLNPRIKLYFTRAFVAIKPKKL